MLYLAPSAGLARQAEFVEVSIGGVDLGHHSDGTLRVMEILIALIQGRGRATLLIEEPETAIHPGLLKKLLDTIDSYTDDGQVLVSTHSPMVLDWATPEELRMVVRENDQTRVFRLTDDQKAAAQSFLEDEGTLGEWVFAGAVDDE